MIDLKVSSQRRPCEERGLLCRQIDGPGFWGKSLLNDKGVGLEAMASLIIRRLVIFSICFCARISLGSAGNRSCFYLLPS
jgi:hypothetical protein